jgi:hypothetical protein
MKSVIVRSGVAVVLALGAWLCWREAGLVDRAADARLALSLLRYDAIEPTAAQWTLSDVIANGGRSMTADERLQLATSRYWRQRFGSRFAAGSGQRVVSSESA